MSFQPASAGGGGVPSMSSTWNCTVWTWKLCGWGSRLRSTHTSVAPSGTTSSMRPMSTGRRLMIWALIVNVRVRSAADSGIRENCGEGRRQPRVTAAARPAARSSSTR